MHQIQIQIQIKIEKYWKKKQKQKQKDAFQYILNRRLIVKALDVDALTACTKLRRAGKDITRDAMRCDETRE